MEGFLSMKKFLLLVFMMMFILSVFAACGNNGSNTPTEENSNRPIQNNQQENNSPTTTPPNETNTNNEIALEFWVEIDGVRFQTGQTASAFFEHFEVVGIGAEGRAEENVGPHGVNRAGFITIEYPDDLWVDIRVRNTGSDQGIAFRDAVVELIEIAWDERGNVNVVLPFGLESLLYGSNSLRDDIIAILGEPSEVESSSRSETLIYGSEEHRYMIHISTDNELAVLSGFTMFDRQR